MKVASKYLNTSIIINKAKAIVGKQMDDKKAKIARINRTLNRINSENEKCLDFLLNGTISNTTYNYRTESNAIKHEQLTEEKLKLENSMSNIDIVERLRFIQGELNRLLKFDGLTKEMLKLSVKKIEIIKTGNL